MKTRFFAIPLATIVFILLSYNPAFAANPTGTTEVKAQVGEFTLSISGFVSPNASILLTVDKSLLGSSIADEKGNFSFNKLPIKRGLSSFCLEAVDQRRLGESLTCLTVPAAKSDILMQDVFLAPTIALERGTITVGSAGLTYGYSMPNANVNITVSESKKYEVKADETGKYAYVFPNFEVGEYGMQAKANYQGKDSLAPTNSVTLYVLTSSDAFSNQAEALRRLFRDWLIWIMLVLTIGIPLLIYVLYQFKPAWFSFVTKNKWFRIIFFRQHKLHHSWFVGF